MSMTIFHNPSCGTSRNVLALIEYSGVEHQVIEYLKNPPSRDVFLALVAQTGLSLRSVLRKKGTPYLELGLDLPEVDDEALVDAVMAHPILMNRPLVQSSKGVRLCRPSDVVLDLLPELPKKNFLKEEGAPFLLDRQITASDTGLRTALREAGLAVDDLEEPHGVFYAYEALDGTPLGFGGFQRVGDAALIRSIIVEKDNRRAKIGKNLVALLLHRALQAGAKTAWLLTEEAAPFFEKAGFKIKPRDEAPASILATRQAAQLCPQNATLLARKIEL